jgi:hypothetical protein
MRHGCFSKKHWGCFGREGGFNLEARFFSAKISPNNDPKINPLTLSKGFFKKKFQ